MEQKLEEDRVEMNLIEIRSGVGLDSSGSGWGPVTGSFEHSNAAYGSVKCWELV
jgi:hypothetical protein